MIKSGHHSERAVKYLISPEWAPPSSAAVNSCTDPEQHSWAAPSPHLEPSLADGAGSILLPASDWAGSSILAGGWSSYPVQPRRSSPGASPRGPVGSSHVHWLSWSFPPRPYQSIVLFSVFLCCCISSHPWHISFLSAHSVV